MGAPIFGIRVAQAPSMKRSRHLTALFVLCLMAIFPEARASLPDSDSLIGELTSIAASEPPLSEIIATYFELERLDGANIRAWHRKIKLAPFLPTLYVGFDQQLKKTQSFSVDDNTSLSGGTVTVGPEENSYDFNDGVGRVLRVRAAWELSETVFSRYDVALAGAKQRESQIRSRAESEIYKTHEARRLYLTQYLLFRGNTPEKAIAAYARYLVLTDRLDAWTGQKFHDLFWRKK